MKNKGIKYHNGEVFQTVLSDGGNYESSDTGIEGKLGEADNRMGAINRYYGIGNDRNLSDYLLNFGWNSKEIMALGFLRFNDGNKEYVGREIIWSAGYSQYIIRDIVQRMSQRPEMVYDYSDTGIRFGMAVWKTDTGKKTYHGKPDDGTAKIKQTQPKQYQRKRKSW